MDHSANDCSVEITFQTEQKLLRQTHKNVASCIFEYPIRAVLITLLISQVTEDLKDSLDLEVLLEQLVPPDVLEHEEQQVPLVDLELPVLLVLEVHAGSLVHEGHPAWEQQVRSAVKLHYIICCCENVVRCMSPRGTTNEGMTLTFDFVFAALQAEVEGAEIEAQQLQGNVLNLSTNLGTATVALGAWAAVVSVALVVIVAVIFRLV